MSGFLSPVLEGQALEDYVQQFVAGIAGLPGPMVRPRWQSEPTNLPDYGVDWAAVGIMRHRPIGIYAAVIHHPDGDGYSEMQRHEELEVLCTFYGKDADQYASNFHNGLMIWQNKSFLRLVGMAFIEVSDDLKNPELIRNRWWNRVDKTMILRRIIRRTYPILNLLSSQGRIWADPGNYVAPWDTNNVPRHMRGQAAGVGAAAATGTHH